MCAYALAGVNCLVCDMVWCVWLGEVVFSSVLTCESACVLVPMVGGRIGLI